eukprot:3576112-Amphidinium_carterae.1
MVAFVEVVLGQARKTCHAFGTDSAVKNVTGTLHWKKFVPDSGRLIVSTVKDGQGCHSPRLHRSMAGTPGSSTILTHLPTAPLQTPGPSARVE